MRGVNKCCLSCKFFRLEDVASGICRVEKVEGGAYPKKPKDDCCGRWRDSGQQYYIRVGWIKGREAEPAG